MLSREGGSGQGERRKAQGTAKERASQRRKPGEPRSSYVTRWDAARLRAQAAERDAGAATEASPRCGFCTRGRNQEVALGPAGGAPRSLALL